MDELILVKTTTYTRCIGKEFTIKGSVLAQLIKQWTKAAVQRRPERHLTQNAAQARIAPHRYYGSSVLAFLRVKGVIHNNLSYLISISYTSLDITPSVHSQNLALPCCRYTSRYI